MPILGPEESSRTYFRGIQRYHQDMDSETYLIRGFTEPIINTPGGIPGWMRVCFANYEANRDSLMLILSEDRSEEDREASSLFPEESWPPLDMQTDFHWIYGFEGVILPGGRIMMGNWLDMQKVHQEDCDRGPFIYWT
jgi:hypothetical protein